MRGQSGVTLLEMVIVVALVGLLAGISYPAVSAGVDSLRLASAGDAAAALLSGALNRAERRQEAVEITFLFAENELRVRSTGAGYRKSLVLPQGVRIAAVLPAPLEDTPTRRLLVFPGGTAPAVTVVLANERGAQRRVRIDPATGVPEVLREPAP